jgi:hypothetical protein
MHAAVKRKNNAALSPSTEQLHEKKGDRNVENAFGTTGEISHWVCNVASCIQ